MVRGAFALVLAAAMGWAGHGLVTPVHPRQVHVSGDGAAPVGLALSLPRAPSVASAELEVVLIRRWQNLEALPDLRRLCRAACDGGADVVRLRRPALNGQTDVLIVDVSAFGAAPALDAGAPIPEDVVGCLGILTTRVWGQTLGITKCDLPEIRTVWRPRLLRPRAPMLSDL
ncbi:MAG: hypothetical protein AAF366_17410 [Pseudomonadota bacterium]